LFSPICHYIKLKVLQKYLWALPEPVLSDEDIAVAKNGRNKHPILTWNEWSNDPIKRAVILAISSQFGRTEPVDWDIVYALTQKFVCFIHFHSFEVEEVHC
jgi:hypothetical protein